MKAPAVRDRHTPKFRAGGGGCKEYWATVIFPYANGSYLNHVCSLPKRHAAPRMRKGVVVEHGTDHLCGCGHSSAGSRTA